MINDSPLTWKERLTFCIGPFVINLCFIIFICCSITTDLHPLEPRNSIALTDCFLLYLIDIIILVFYGIIMGSWSELLFGVENVCLSFAIIISYPVFFLMFLPFAIYRVMVRIGTPARLWERVFGGSGLSLENLQCDGGRFMLIRYIYIGIPFLIVSLVYIGVMVLLSPMWYFLLTPIGMGMYSICFSVGFHTEDVRVSSVNDRVGRTYRWGMFFNVFIVALVQILSCACYMGMVGSHWWAVLSFTMSLVYFVLCAFPTAKSMICGHTPAKYDLGSI